MIVVSKLSSTFKQLDDGQLLQDTADIISSFWTYCLTVGLTAVMVLKTFILSPIECSVAVRFSQTNFDDYVNNYCFMKGSIGMFAEDIEESFPQTKEQWRSSFDRGHIGYYPWIPLYLGLIGLLPFLVSKGWQMFCRREAGTDLGSVIEMARKAQFQSGKGKRKSLQCLASRMRDIAGKRSSDSADWWSLLQRKLEAFLGFRICCFYRGTFVNFGYFFMKLIYLALHFGTLISMYFFLELDSDHIWFGFQVFSSMMRGQFSKNTKVFPRVTFCAVPFKHNALNVAVAQCVLPGNLYSEVIFALLWVWHAVCIIPMAVTLVLWIYRALSESSRQDFIQECLSLLSDPKINHACSSSLKHFVRYLQPDGVFVLRMIYTVVGRGITAEIVAALWQRYELEEEFWYSGETKETTLSLKCLKMEQTEI